MLGPKMALLARSFVFVTFAVAVAGCGAAGTPPTGPAVAQKSCVLYPVRKVTQTCRSPDGRWLLSETYGKCRYLYFTSRGGKRVRFASPVGCGDGNQPGGTGSSGGTWVKPHLLVLGGNFTVITYDPSTQKLRLLAALSDFLVSPNGEWLAGTGTGDPQVSRTAVTVYLLPIHGAGCFVVPGRSSDIAGFTPDSMNVVVYRGYHHGQQQYRQFAISSLRSGCPKGPNEVRP